MFDGVHNFFSKVFLEGLWTDVGPSVFHRASQQVRVTDRSVGPAGCLNRQRLKGEESCIVRTAVVGGTTQLTYHHAVVFIRFINLNERTQTDKLRHTGSSHNNGERVLRFYIATVMASTMRYQGRGKEKWWVG